MTRKDYELIAGAIRRAIQTNSLDERTLSVGDLLGELCQAFIQDNPRFDMRRFCEAVSRED